MLPDFLEIKGGVHRQIIEQFERMVAAKAPLISRISVHKQTEGDRYSIEREDGVVEEQQFKEFVATFTIPSDITPDNADEVVRALELAADSMASQSETALFASIGRVTDEVGNSIDVGGKPFTPEMLLDMLDKMWIEFDDQGRPEMPTMVMHPTMFESIRSRFPEFDKDPLFMSRHAEIMARKKEEWRDRESNRKLVG
jgi:hypothetical protein